MEALQCEEIQTHNDQVHLEKQVGQLKKRTAASLHNVISVRRLEKFARLEEEILKYVCRNVKRLLVESLARLHQFYSQSD